MITFLPFFNNQVSHKKSDFSPKFTNPFQIKTHSQPLQDEVSFGCRRGPKKLFYTNALNTAHVVDTVDKAKPRKFRVVELDGIPCPYCGRTMISAVARQNFGVFAAKAKGEVLQRKLVSLFDKKRDTLEKEIAGLLFQESKRYPQKTLQELAVSLVANSERRLIIRQISVINKSKTSLKHLTGDTKLKAMKAFENAEDLLLGKNPEKPFKRKEVLKSFGDLYREEQNPQNKQVLLRVLRSMLKLPDSFNNKDAFIVKYQRRESREIAERLLTPYVATQEHLSLASKGGSNSKHNALAVDGLCNRKRGNTPWDVFVATKPQKIRRFLAKNLDAIDKKIKAGALPDYEKYPEEVSETIFKESKGQIVTSYLEEYPSMSRRKFKKKFGYKSN